MRLMEMVSGAKERVLDTIRQEAKGEPSEKEVGIAMTTAARQAEDLNDSLKRLIDHMPKTPYKMRQAKRLKKAVGDLETTITAYGHEVLPHLK